MVISVHNLLNAFPFMAKKDGQIHCKYRVVVCDETLLFSLYTHREVEMLFVEDKGELCS